MRPTASAMSAAYAAAGAIATACALAAAGVGCLAPPPPCTGSACAPACPRDAAQDASGRCACVAGTSQVLGACVPPPVADSYCGIGSRMTAAGCTFRTCADGDVLDLASGLCVPQATVVRGTPCAAQTAAVVLGGRLACVPVDAKCPRGSHLEGNVCARPPQCPAGTLPEPPPAATSRPRLRDVPRACRPLVGAGPGGGRTVDIGAWAVLVLGIDGGLGTPELCRPLARRPDAFGLSKPVESALRLRITLTVPDQDLSRVRARVLAFAEAQRGRTPADDGGAERQVDASDGGSSGETPSPQDGPLPAGVQAAAEDAVGTLLEPLRGLGGEATAAEVKVEVRCGAPER